MDSEPVVICQRTIIDSPSINLVASMIKRNIPAVPWDDQLGWYKRIDTVNKLCTQPKPTDPDPRILNSYSSLPKEQARKHALLYTQEKWKTAKANALYTRSFIASVENSSGFPEIPQIAEATPIWLEQFRHTCSIFGIDCNQPSQIDPGLSIINSYSLRLCPLPHDLVPLVMPEEVQGLSMLFDTGQRQAGVYFSAEVVLKEDEIDFRVVHSGDHTKVHEDFHMLRFQINGVESYFRSAELGQIGEGIAPIFELWFNAASARGEHVLNTYDLEAIDKGLSPVDLKMTNQTDASTSEFWKFAMAENAIYTRSHHLKISQEIMKFLAANHNIGFVDFVKTFLVADSYSDFIDKIQQLGPTSESLSELTSYLQK